MKNTGIFLLLFLCCGFFTPGAASASKASDREFSQAQAALTRLDSSKGAPRTYRDRWVAVISRLETFSAENSRHSKAPEALYLAAEAREKMAEISRRSDDVAAAKKAYITVATTAPQSPFAAKGLWAAARLAEKGLNDPEAAYRLYAQLSDEQSHSKYAIKARQELKRLARYAPPSAVVSAPIVADEEARTPRGTLTGLRSWSNPGYTRVVIDLSQETAYSSTLLAADPSIGAPPRLYLDLQETVPVGGLPESSVVNDGLLRQIRTGKPSLGRTRVVLDLLSFDNYKIFTLTAPFRIVVDISGEAAGQGGEVPTPAVTCTLTPSPVLPIADPIANLVAAAPSEAKINARAAAVPSLPSFRIVIDAGHGGKDPGAIGFSGVLEKDIVLSLALLLADEVKEKLGWEVTLTRSDDTFIPLEERTAIANKIGADLFLSLHANASPNAAAHGIETYYLNYSKNEKAAAVAARENGTTLRAVSDLEQILFDLMAHSKIQESSRLASDLQHALITGITKEYGDVRNLGVKQGPFYVLLGANMPSVLVEAAFLSNAKEEARLTTREYQKEATRAIIAGLRAYTANANMAAR